MKDVVHLHNGVRTLLADRNLVVRRPDRATGHHVDERERSREQCEIEEDDGRGRGARCRLDADAVDWRFRGQQQRNRGSEGNAEPHGRRKLEPGNDAERNDPCQAAGEINRVCLEGRELRHFTAHALRKRHEQRRDDHEEQRQQHRALDDDDLCRGAAREIDAARRGYRDFQSKEIDGRDDDRLDQREPLEQPRARRRQETSETDAEKAGEEDEVREIRQQPDVGRHPSYQRNFEEENQKRREECSRRTQAVATHAAADGQTVFTIPVGLQVCIRG